MSSAASPPPPDDLATVAVEPSPLDDLRAELASLRERLEASDQAKAELAATVATLNQRLIVTAPPPPPPAPVEWVTSTQHAETGAALERLQASVSALDQRIDRLDGRVTAVSTELANQLTEIGNDIEPMHDSAERLAAEQARYQIQFRQDLAELAERIRRPGTT